MPNSAAWPRAALTSCVRCRTSSSRAESTIAWAYCSADRTATLGMPGRDAASLMASASLRAFLPRLCERLDVLRRDQLHRVAQPSQPTPPVVRAAARLQYHVRRRQLGKERLHLRPSHVAAQDSFLVVIAAMQREDSLGRVEANALKVHADGPSGSDVDNQTLARDAAGPSTPTMMAQTEGSADPLHGN